MGKAIFLGNYWREEKGKKALVGVWNSEPTRAQKQKSNCDVHEIAYDEMMSENLSNGHIEASMFVLLAIISIAIGVIFGYFVR